MQYQSTRDKNLKASSAQAILNGLAPDGGLYTMPSFDEVKFDYTTVLNMDTMSMSTKILSKLHGALIGDRHGNTAIQIFFAIQSHHAG